MSYSLIHNSIVTYLLLVVVDASAPVGAVEGEYRGVSLGSSSYLDWAAVVALSSRALASKYCF